MLASLLTVFLLTASPDQSTQPPLLTAEGSPTDQGAPAADHPFVGVFLDVGLPDGAGAGLMVMPVSFLRVQLSGLTNGVGAGVRFGVTLMAFPTWPVRPFLAADGAYVWGGTAPWLAQFITNDALRTVVSNVNLGFVNVHAGLELGSKHVAFVLRGGVSYIDADLGTHVIDLGSGVTVTATGSRLHGVVPSARIGLLFCF
jgi:hypothetical protein